MNLPDDFIFSQNSLQDYGDCQRRFYLRYIAHTEWPAIETEPVLEQEHHMEMGSQFHRMVHQSIIGIPVANLLSENTDPLLESWWKNYLQNPPPNLPAVHLAESSLIAPLAGYRISAVYDLLAIDPPHLFCIVDWKTSKRKPNREHLLKRLQTRIYPFLLHHSGANLNNLQNPAPENIRMIYWFAVEPTRCEVLNSSPARAENDRKFLTSTILEIASMKEQDFLLTLDAKKCLFCKYRSLCDRGSKAGDWNESNQGEISDETPLEDLIARAEEVAF
jgi:hypothetical protein